MEGAKNKSAFLIWEQRESEVRNVTPTIQMVREEAGHRTLSYTEMIILILQVWFPRLKKTFKQFKLVV